MLSCSVKPDDPLAQVCLEWSRIRRTETDRERDTHTHTEKKTIS